MNSCALIPHKTQDISTDLYLNGLPKNRGARMANIIILPPRFPRMPSYHLLINRDSGPLFHFHPYLFLFFLLLATSTPPELRRPCRLHQPNLDQKTVASLRCSSTSLGTHFDSYQICARFFSVCQSSLPFFRFLCRLCY